VPQVVQPQVVGQRVGAAVGVELGEGLVGGPDGRLEPAGDELRLAQRATTRRGEHQLLAAIRPTGQVDAQLVSQRTGQPNRPRLAVLTPPHSRPALRAAACGGRPRPVTHGTPRLALNVGSTVDRIAFEILGFLGAHGRIISRRFSRCVCLSFVLDLYAISKGVYSSQYDAGSDYIHQFQPKRQAL
jgi:hypothetical protein